jgi:hypothetical protein
MADDFSQKKSRLVLKKRGKQLYQALATKRTSLRSEPMSLVNIELHRTLVTHLQ